MRVTRPEKPIIGAYFVTFPGQRIGLILRLQRHDRKASPPASNLPRKASTVERGCRFLQHYTLQQRQHTAKPCGPPRSPLLVTWSLGTVCCHCPSGLECNILTGSAVAFRLKLRNEVVPNASITDPNAYQEKVTLTREIAEVLRKNVVQAVKAEPTNSTEDERWRMFRVI